MKTWNLSLGLSRVSQQVLSSNRLSAWLSTPPIVPETIIRLADDKNTADVVFLDFAKTFDSVNHRFVLAKLESFGLCKKVVDGSDPTC